MNKTPVKQVLDQLQRQIVPLKTKRYRAPLMSALGGVLAFDLTACAAHPAESVSAMDGYALGSLSDQFDLLPGRSVAGHPCTIRLRSGQAIRVLTGAVVPDGAVCVVEQEVAIIQDRRLTLERPAQLDRNIRKPGEDIHLGQKLLSAGTRLCAQHLPSLMASGIVDVDLYLPLRVGLIATGDELILPGLNRSSGQLINTNQPMIQTVLEAQGHQVVDLGQVSDQPSLIRQRLLSATDLCDVIVTLGGASVGDEDHVRDCLDQVNHWRLALKPGSPMAVGQIARTPVFALPGNPAAAWVCALLVLIPCLSQLSHRGWFEPQGFQLPAAFHRTSPAGRREYWRARVREGQVEVFPKDGAARLAGLSFSEGLSMLDEDQTEVEPGQMVTYFPYSSWGL